MRATMTAGLVVMLLGCSQRVDAPEAAPPVETPQTVEELVLSIGSTPAIEGRAGGTTLRVDDVLPMDAPEWAPGALSVDGAWMSGDMGSVRGFASEPYRTTASFDGTNVTVQLYGDGAVMTNLYITNFREMELGHRYEFSGWDTPPGAVFASGVACSGPDEGVWTYDQGPEMVVMAASMGPDGMVAFQVGLQLGTADYTGHDWAFVTFKLSPGLGW